jgi:hypothetical protein
MTYAQYINIIQCTELNGSAIPNIVLTNEATLVSVHSDLLDGRMEGTDSSESDDVSDDKELMFKLLNAGFFFWGT